MRIYSLRKQNQIGVMAAIMGLAVLTGLLLLPVGISRAAAQGAPAASTAAVAVTVAKVQRKDVPEFVRGIGNVQAYRSVLVRARVDGTLDKIAFREGQDVKPGDLLAEIDPRPYAATLAQARAKRAGDVAQLDNARRDLALQVCQVCRRTNYASRQQVDTQQALVEQDLANIQADDASIDAAALNLSFCQITSPIGRGGGAETGGYRQSYPCHRHHWNRQHHAGASDFPGLHLAAG